ncbi:MAG: rod shape-determining protein MreD [Candidatus Saccharibacteria bacterium]
MKQYLLISIMIGALILQVSFLPALRPFGVVPNLVLIVVAASALTGPLVSAMILALGGGFILDLASGSDFGLRTGLLAFAVLICAYVARSGLRFGSRLQLLIVVVVISTLTPLIIVPEIIFAGGRVNFPTVIARWIATIGCNAALAVTLGPIFATIARSNQDYGI